MSELNDNIRVKRSGGLVDEIAELHGKLSGKEYGYFTENQKNEIVALFITLQDIVLESDEAFIKLLNIQRKIEGKPILKCLPKGKWYEARN